MTFVVSYLASGSARLMLWPEAPSVGRRDGRYALHSFDTYLDLLDLAESPNGHLAGLEPPGFPHFSVQTVLRAIEH
jgi:hypothetical protein